MAADYQVVIIGAGVVGLATARALGNNGVESVLIIEKDQKFGTGISSRNSEVIHSGIYYPLDTLKSKYCIRGRDLLYDYCPGQNVYHKQCGKIIVAQENQKSDLEKLFLLGKYKNMGDMKWLEKNEIQDFEPSVSSSFGLFIPKTGIIDSHELMNAFYQESTQSNHDYLFKSEVLDISYKNSLYTIEINSPNGESEFATCNWVINAAGLRSDLVSNMLIPTDQTPTLVFSKGVYFSLTPNWSNLFNHLVYPLPDKDHRSLGVHVSFDRIGQVKLGPDAHFLKERIEDYSIDESLRNIFFESASQYLPGLQIEELSPNFSGIRPKIDSINHTFQDFYIRHEIDKGYPGFINLIGIDSPGLTSAIAIGEDVASWVQK